MKQTLKIPGIIFLIALISTSLTSCIKKKLECEQNCANVNFAGKIINKATNTPIQGHEVSASLYRNQRCLLCPAKKVGSGRTNNNGMFSFSAEIDTTVFNDSHITVSVKTPSGFLLYPEPVGPGLSNERQFSSIQFYNFEPVEKANMKFEFYPAVLLTIQLHRSSAISPQRHLGLEFSFDQKTSIWGLIERDSNADTTLTINTSANMLTRIISRKFNSQNSLITRIDSIFCFPNGSNTISIDY
ncbi:MAG TPA: hypothetical protein VM368_04720 [Flavisolibacter sp.]|nr:hypothetical protein [Flavisolibacter sp.]